MLTSLTTTLTTEESSKYWPRLPIAIPFPPWQVICGLVSRAPITTRPLYILGINIIRARFYGYTIVPALVVHVRQHDVVCIHGIEPISILDPVRAKWCIDGCGIVDDIIEPHMSPIHNIERPQRRIFDEDYIIRYELILQRTEILTMLDKDVAYIPEDEWHRPAGLRIPFLCIIPLYTVSHLCSGE
jgi:hypothetical protein